MKKYTHKKAKQKRRTRRAKGHEMKRKAAEVVCLLKIHWILDLIVTRMQTFPLTKTIKLCLLSFIWKMQHLISSIKTLHEHIELKLKLKNIHVSRFVREFPIRFCSSRHGTHKKINKLVLVKLNGKKLRLEKKIRKNALVFLLWRIGFNPLARVRIATLELSARWNRIHFYRATTTVFTRVIFGVCWNFSIFISVNYFQNDRDKSQMRHVDAAFQYDPFYYTYSTLVLLPFPIFFWRPSVHTISCIILIDNGNIHIIIILCICENINTFHALSSI